MRRIGLCLVALLLACTPPAGGDADGGDLDGALDLRRADPPDLMLGPIQTGALGAACTSAADCTKVAKDAVCFREYLLNSLLEQRVPGGYCSATCETDVDCGPTGKCLEVGIGEAACFARCDRSGICRGGYACLLADGICAPAGNLTCDPTMNDGKCDAVVDLDPMKPKVPGGCLREAYEPLGRCAAACTLGIGSCPIDVFERTTQHCVYLDTTMTLDLKLTRDKWKGLICQHDYFPSALDGQPCKYAQQCLEGSQCDLLPGGSNRCYPLCIPGGTPSCKVGTTCQDQLRAGPMGPGLCK